MKNKSKQELIEKENELSILYYLISHLKKFQKVLFFGYHNRLVRLMTSVLELGKDVVIVTFKGG